MYRNYFYLYRCAVELNELLSGKKVLEAFTQEKDKLFLRIPLEDKPDHHLVCDTSSLSAAIYRRDKHFKAKKNTISFFENSIPDKIESVNAALFERTIRFKLKDSSLFFVIKGNDSNVFSIQSGNITSFKKSDMTFDESTLSFINNEDILFRFLDSFNQTHLDWKIFSATFPFAGKDLFLEAKAKSLSDYADDFKTKLRICIQSVLREKIAVYYDFEAGKSRLLPVSFIKDEFENETIRTFGSYFEALNYYFQLKYKNKQEISLRTKIEKYIDNELERMSSKLNSFKFRIEAGSKEAEYRSYGNILLMNIHHLHKGMTEITAQDQITGINVKIKLDEKLSPQKNIDRFFDKSKDEKINFEQSKELYSNALIRLNRLNEIKNQIQGEVSHTELEAISNKLKINRNAGNTKMEEKTSFKHYILHGKYHVFVGKDSRNNDELTTQFAKQNDLWFHARGVAGSHVVLRVDNTKEVVPKSIIKEAAALAAYYSKAKTSGMAPVSYTFRKYVHKKKGLDPGQVILSKEDVILVKPEIPKECEPAVTDLI